MPTSAHHVVVDGLPRLVDRFLLTHLNAWASGGAVARDAVTAYVAGSQWAMAALLALALVAPRPRVRVAARLGFVAAVAATGASKLLNLAFDRARPFVAHPDLTVLVHHGPDRTFPSDSASAAFAIATTLWLADRRWGAVALVMAGGLAVGRVAAGMHYPTDVAAGALLGTAVGVAVRRYGTRTSLPRTWPASLTRWASAASAKR